MNECTYVYRMVSDSLALHVPGSHCPQHPAVGQRCGFPRQMDHRYGSSSKRLGFTRTAVGSCTWTSSWLNMFKKYGESDKAWISILFKIVLQFLWQLLWVQILKIPRSWGEMRCCQARKFLEPRPRYLGYAEYASGLAKHPTSCRKPAIEMKSFKII